MAKPKNERKTENIVRDELRRLGYYEEDNPAHVEEQKSSIAAVSRLLRAASKSGKGGPGAPEFIASSEKDPDFLVIIECKADLKDHASGAVSAILAGKPPQEEADAYAKRVQRYAVDGVLHYAKALSKDFNVIAVAVSGETKAAAKIEVFLNPKGAIKPKALTTKNGKTVDKLLPWADYLEHAVYDPSIQRLRLDELMAFSRDLHDFMRDHAKLTESEKPLLVSGTLIALRSKAFAKSFDEYAPEDLQKEWLKVIAAEIGKADIPKAKKDTMVQPYSSIAVHPELSKQTKAYPRGPLNELIKRLNEKVWPFISVYHDFDVVGQFYGEFLKYTGGDKKALGIVLTPRHVTELFARLANVSKDSKVLDICAGTGGFLISAMHQMMKSAQSEAEREAIRKHGLIGVEQQPNMYALAASNMILRGDGKANLYQGSCFDAGITKAIKNHHCDIAFLNPPFSQGDADLHELKFVKHLLDCLVPGGTGIAIVPMSCAIAPHEARGELLKAHTLEAVMSMPDELFYPVGTVTCIMVFTAHKPHAQSNKKSWFGYWKNDGFVKTKHRGRIDLHGHWPAIRERWVEAFRNREIHPGESVTKQVGEKDEWCAEAYIETDYSKITQEDFERVVRNYAIFRLLGAQASAEPTSEESGNDAAE
ncbi:HsdM family class I SAM-dependent methyltransferase [Myxococcus virescens]|uniref:HsdM family class I SAM-dependent methyltransferase n=1 Tax=Myxococcus virescens TaxID=83456 RepID=UPI003DA4AD6C